MKVETLFKVSALALTLAFSLGANAASIPKGSTYDKRIQYVMYNEDDVVIVNTRAGNSTLIQLEPDEYLVNLPTGGLSMGDTKAWTLGVRGNNIFLKPKGPFPDTNINLVTNKRTYAISLIDVGEKGAAAWQVRFRYPAQPVRVAGGAGGSTPRQDKGPCSDGVKNLNWFKYGDQSLAPTEIWDDGRFTCMRFPTSKAKAAVTRYTPDSDLKEGLPNFGWEDDVLVIYEVSEEFRLRLGKKVLGVKTDSLRDASFNRNMTSTGEKRVVLDGK